MATRRCIACECVTISSRQTENEQGGPACAPRFPAGRRLSALLPVAPDLQFRPPAPPFCTRGDPVCEDATGSSRFWSPTAFGGARGLHRRGCREGNFERSCFDNPVTGAHTRCGFLGAFVRVSRRPAQGGAGL